MRPRDFTPVTTSTRLDFNCRRPLACSSRGALSARNDTAQNPGAARKDTCAAQMSTNWRAYDLRPNLRAANFEPAPSAQRQSYLGPHLASRALPAASVAPRTQPSGSCAAPRRVCARLRSQRAPLQQTPCAAHLPVATCNNRKMRAARRDDSGLIGAPAISTAFRSGRQLSRSRKL